MKRPIKSGLAFVGAVALMLVLCACMSASVPEATETEDAAVVTPLETVAAADELADSASEENDATEVADSAEPEETEDDVDLEVKEVRIFTDNWIQYIVECLQSDQTRNVAVEYEAYGGPHTQSLHGYYTDSTELSVARGIPVYEYKHGKFIRAVNGIDFYVFDQGVPIYRLGPATIGSMVFIAGYDPPYHYRSSELERNTDEVFEESTTKKFCFIYCAQGNVLYDGVDAWLVCNVGGEYGTAYDSLSDDLVSTPGIEDLELGTILERQTFAYESPTD